MSCERQLILKEFEFDKKLVINSLNKVGEGIRLNISESVDIQSNPDAIGLAGEAVITVTNQGVEVERDTIYILDGAYNKFPETVNGGQYGITVEMDGYPKVSAEASVPLYDPHLEIDTAYTFSTSAKFRLDLKDKAPDEFYMITAFVVGLQVDGTDSSEAIYPVNFTSSDKIFETKISTLARQNSFALFNDELFNGASRKIELNVEKAEFEHDNFMQDRVRIIVKSLSKSTYQYYLSLLENNHVYGGPLATTVNDQGNVMQGLGMLGFYTEGAATYTIP